MALQFSRNFGVRDSETTQTFKQIRLSTRLWPLLRPLVRFRPLNFLPNPGISGIVWSFRSRKAKRNGPPPKAPSPQALIRSPGGSQSDKARPGGTKKARREIRGEFRRAFFLPGYPGGRFKESTQDRMRLLEDERLPACTPRRRTRRSGRGRHRIRGHRGRGWHPMPRGSGPGGSPPRGAR